MKITHCDVKIVSLSLREPYTIAYETVNAAVNVYLRVETSTGIVGYGCAAPDLQVTGETAEGVHDDFLRVMAPVLMGADPLRRSLIMEAIQAKLPKKPASQALVDMVLFDILGKTAGLPLYRILGGFRTRMRTSITIGILPVGETMAQAKTFVAQGFKALKIKGGIDVEDDVERVCAVRRAVGPKVELRFDANQGFGEDEVVYFVNQVKEAGLSLIEQPTPRRQDRLLGRVTRKIPLPVMADESLMGLGDAFRLARKHRVDMVNVKLMKVGGIDQALKINAVARAAGLEVMVGCMDESALSVAAGLHFALARPNVAYADLDGHLDLLNDPGKGAVILRKGVLWPTKNPGLGFDPRL